MKISHRILKCYKEHMILLDVMRRVEFMLCYEEGRN